MNTLNRFSGLSSLVSHCRWPRSGDRPFVTTDDEEKGVGFSPELRSRQVFIWDGYMCAASTLIDECRRDPGKRYFLVYPIFFNYRHALELGMKWIVAQYGSYVASGEVAAERGHDLWKLWKPCKKVIIDIGTNTSAVQYVEQVIKDFHELDNSGMRLRYATGRDGGLYELPSYRIDLDNLQEVMMGIEHFFDGVDGQLDANVSAAARC
ncbi:hypothetical protein NYO91_04795 [Arhodomonas aquaeolei]|uniref:hypothetical protein n=1 Tax=Arhodomonas aquaeolei TaxID=2369 RepID=UPI002167B5D7|nr:hypothetical protein [Arhodomonas aquaeolei]MCS4503396.1 hypothetical protein [Arhodomonas aquaeolei]